MRSLCIVAMATLGMRAASAGSITGTVVDGSARPLAAVALSLSGTTSALARTDAAGAFALRGLGAGRYTLRVSAEAGLVLPSAERTLELGENTTVTVELAVLPASTTLIPAIQGRAHLSPLDRESVRGVPGIVTAIRGRLGFYMQNPLPDADPETSEGIFVLASPAAPPVRPGDLVVVDGRIQEYYGGGRDAGDLSVTQLKASQTRLLLSGLDAPAPITLGEAGRMPPDRVVCDDGSGNAEDSPFDPQNDGMDFFESLEDMLVEVREAVVVGSVHTTYGEFQVVGDGGRHATTMTRRGGLLLAAGDSNPERITVDVRADPDIVSQPIPPVTVGDRFAGPIVGPLDYSFSDYKILPLVPLPSIEPAGLPREVAPDIRDERTLTVATLNIENYSARSSDRKTRDLAATVVSALRSPDILALQEVQDDSGPEDDGVTTADRTYRRLIEAIRREGGPESYEYREIAPLDNQDGGEPGGNIRVGLLVNSARLRFVERAGDPAGAVRVASQGGRAILAPSPGLISPGHPALADSRKPLACEVEFAGRRLFLVAVHLASKSGDPQVFARSQPVPLRSETVRTEQALLIRDFVRAVLAIEPAAPIIVLGDFNEFAYAPPLTLLKSDVLFDLAEQLLPEVERYTYTYRGNSQDLDHVLVSVALFAGASPRVWIPHRYAEYLYGVRQTDHDPVLAAFTFPDTD